MTMEIIAPPVKKFLPMFERFEPAVHDPTAMREAKTCLKKYFLKIILGFQAPGINYPITFGVAYHKFREALTKTNELKAGLEAALKLWPGDPVVGSKWDFLTKARLIASCMTAYNHRKKEIERGQIIVIAPERPFALFLSDGITRRGGRMDEGTRWNNQPWARDFKTSSKTEAYWERLIEPNDQFSTYTWGYSQLCGERARGVIVEVMFNTKKEGPKVFTKLATRTPQQVAKWEEDQIHFERILTLCREADIWPKEESQCPFCEFRSVCSAPSEAAEASRLESHFKQKAWDFTSIGDVND